MLTIFFRALLLYAVVILFIRMMGKRQIGQLEPGELVLTMMISDLATVPMQDFGIPLFTGIIPILTLLSLSLLISQLSLHHLRFRALVCGTPAILVQNGKLQQQAMRKNRFTLDELLEQLRGQGIATVADVKYAILENSGQLSVLPFEDKQPPTAQQLGVKITQQVTLPIVVINDGRLLSKNLAASGHDEAWLAKELKKRRLTSHRQVFLLTVDGQGSVFCVKKEAP